MHTSWKRIFILAFAAVPLLVAGCGDGSEGEGGMNMDTTAMRDSSSMQSSALATVNLSPTGVADSVRGQISFSQEQNGVRVSGQVKNLSQGEHGFHIHENGACGNQGKAAGGHFAPSGNKHGAPSDNVHHVGDLGNIQADQSGMAQVDTTVQYLKLSGQHSIIGKGMIVHQGEDDLTSQPSGDAGPRVACGVISMQGAMGGNAVEDTMNTMQSTGESGEGEY